VKETNVASFKIFSRHSPGQTDKNHEPLNPNKRLSPRVEPATSCYRYTNQLDDTFLSANDLLLVCNSLTHPLQCTEQQCRWFINYTRALLWSQKVLHRIYKSLSSSPILSQFNHFKLRSFGF